MVAALGYHFLEYNLGGLHLSTNSDHHLVVGSDVSSTPMRKPCEKLVLVLHVYSEPSGVVPGSGQDGHSNTLHFGGVAEDMTAPYFFRVFFVKVRGLGALVRSSPLVSRGSGFEPASLHYTLQGKTRFL